MTPDTAARLNIAQEHFRQNRLPAAEEALRAILDQDEANVPALTLLAGIQFRSAQLPEALETIEAILEKQPNHRDAIGLSAIIHRTQGDHAGATRQFQLLIREFERLIAAGKGTAELYSQLGSCWLDVGDPVAAGVAFKKAIELDRGQPRNYYNLGLALKMAGKSFETFATFKRAIQLDPDFHDSYVQLWDQMRQLVLWKQGLPLLELGMRRHPDSTQMKVMLAMTYGRSGQPERAEQLFKSAVAADALAGPPYAHWLQEEGRFAESIPILKESIRQKPLQGLAYYNLAIAKCFEVEGKTLADLIAPLFGESSLNPEERMFLYYALAKNFDQDRNYELAMRNYDLANEQAYGLYVKDDIHDPAGAEPEDVTLQKIYSQEMLESLQIHGSKERTPIFIVGMIRTGTTLLDQILSSHPKVQSAGEQAFWQVSSGRMNRRWLNSVPSPEDIRELATQYLDVLRDAAGGADRVTDKMPTNFLHMGLMSIVFPESKFIHIRRSPMDTCVSIYTTFLGHGTQFAYNKQNIIDYYRAYLQTMDFWRSVIPKGQMIEIDYEDLVTNKEIVLRELLDFCGLEWDDSVLGHERNRSQVSTPSLWTARQPVNADSIEKWRKYEPWLGKLLELRELTHPPARSGR